MKRFFETENDALEGNQDKAHLADAGARASTILAADTMHDDGAPVAARIAVYDDLLSAPRVEDVCATAGAEFIELLATRTYELSRERGGSLPYSVIREVVENLIHAHFAEVVVSVLDNGTTIRFSDHGPGIDDKERSFAPGFSTATREMKAIIRGVGSGLPIVKEYLSFSGGYVTVEDNLGAGTVVTLRLEPPTAKATDPDDDMGEPVASGGDLSTRQKQVLSLAMELGTVGPSIISRELRVALSTAYRDLATLEGVGLLVADDAGKRSLTERGVSYLDALFAS